MSGWRKILHSRPATLIARAGTVLRWTLRAVLVLLIVDLFYLAITWPDWHGVATGPIPKSAFMLDYEQEHGQNGQPGRLRWQPVPLASMPKHLQRAAIVAEDSRFYEHSGFDLIAFKEAMDYNFAEGRFAVGASTISQQTVKNLFLSSSKTPLRKWHELILTWGMERHLNKRRILELYLNIAEFGPGIYGVQAASQAYWGVNVSQLDARQAAELAATLPSPIKNNPITRTPQFEKRAARILRLVVRYPGDAADEMIGFPDAQDIDLRRDDEDTVDVADPEPPTCTGDDCPADTAGQIPTRLPAMDIPTLEDASRKSG